MTRAAGLSLWNHGHTETEDITCALLCPMIGQFYTHSIALLECKLYASHLKVSLAKSDVWGHMYGMQLLWVS